MAIHIKGGKNHFGSNLSESKVQSIPFTIHADCEAAVSKYFEPYVEKLDNNVLKGSFRGYPLRGQQLIVPDGYVGLVLHESIAPRTEADQRNFYVINKFKTFRYWNWDKIPSKDDVLQKALDWIDIAEALHSPVADE